MIISRSTEPLRSVASIIIALAAAAFVWLTSRRLPAIVASHFDLHGAADGFMARTTYAAFMLAFAAGLPLLVALLPNLLFRSAHVRLNLPHREYWLAPERRPETVTFLCRHNARFAFLLTLFLCYVHWLVVRANAAAPPRLSSPLLVAGLILFGVTGLVWFGVLLARFQRVPPH